MDLIWNEVHREGPNCNTVRFEGSIDAVIDRLRLFHANSESKYMTNIEILIAVPSESYLFVAHVPVEAPL